MARRKNNKNKNSLSLPAIVVIFTIVTILVLLIITKAGEPKNITYLVDEQGNIVGEAKGSRAASAIGICVSYCSKSFSTLQECYDCCLEAGVKLVKESSVCYK